MAKKTRRGKAKKTIDWAAIGRWAARVGTVFALVGVAFGLTFGVHELRARSSAIMRAQADAPVVRVGFTWPPLPGSPNQTWLPEQDQEELIRVAVRAAGEVDPLSHAPLRDVSRILGRTGWFDAMPRVRVVEPGVLHVSGEWRQPAAVVRWEGRDHLISTRAMPMPPVYRAGGSNRPVILGSAHGPGEPGTPGAGLSMAWPGQDVRSALELLTILWNAGLLGQVAGVDVAGYNRGGPIEIVTTGGGRIVWGSAPDEWKPGEPSVEERVRRLRGLVDRTDRLDGGQKRIEIHRARVEIDLSHGG